MEKFNNELKKYLSKYFRDRGFVNVGINNEINIKNDGKTLYAALVQRDQLFYLYVWNFSTKIEMDLSITLKPDKDKSLHQSIGMNYELNDNLDEILENMKSDIDNYISKFITIVNDSKEIIGVRK
ncbi:MAG: hypothetical protein BWX53_00373 [Parcubacteria group bacterium ADurb.Bin016]|nr:MAG: hypothetical protein BWX53_00373 [Parcubacteria group bacterium ADurb.Bin016]